MLAMNTRTDGERSDIEELLPWHAAGTLGHGDMQRVETALANDPELARRYELVREELAQTIHLNEALGAPSPRAMEALFAKIDAEPARSAVASMNLGARLAGIFRRPLAAHAGLVGGRSGDCDPAAGRTHCRHDREGKECG